MGGGVSFKKIGMKNQKYIAAAELKIKNIILSISTSVHVVKSMSVRREFPRFMVN